MKKMITLSMTLLFISVVLLGCQSQNNGLKLKEEIKEVNIFKSNEFKKENLDFVISSSDTKILETVKSIINNTTKQKGIVDTTTPVYDLEIIYADNSKEQFYLWLLENGKGSLMRLEDTKTIYNFPEEMNDELYVLIQSNENQ